MGERSVLYVRCCCSRPEGLEVLREEVNPDQDAAPSDPQGTAQYKRKMDDPKYRRARHKRYRERVMEDPDRRAAFYDKQLERKRARRESGRAEYGPKPEVCPLCLHRDSLIVWDHDHATGKFRGYICSPCNRTLGLHKDDPGTFMRMSQYLEGTLQVGPAHGDARADPDTD